MRLRRIGIAVSKLTGKCQNCKLIYVYDNKRMAACAILPLTEQITAPMARKYTQITINMGEYGTINTSAEEIYGFSRCGDTAHRKNDAI